MKKLITIFTITITVSMSAQVGIGIETPDTSAILDVTSIEKGFLPPRMTTAQRDAINAGNPSPGLVVYNLDIHCLEYFNAAEWVSFCEGSEAEGTFTYWVDDSTIEDNAKYLYIENGTGEDFSGNLFVYHDLWYFPYTVAPYIIKGIDGSSIVIQEVHSVIYNLGTVSVTAGQTIRLKIEIKTQTAQPVWEPTGSATIPKTNELYLSRSVIGNVDVDPVTTTLPITVTSYGPN